MSPSLVNSAARLVSVAVIIAGLYAGRDLLIPLSLAAILSFILFPLVRRLSLWGLPQSLAVAVVIAGALTLLLGGMTIAGKQVAQLVEDVPQYEMNLREKARFLHSWFGQANVGAWRSAVDTLSRVEQEVRDPETDNKPVKIEVAQDRPIGVLLEYVRSAVPSLATAGLVLVVTIFMLLQYGDLRDRAVRVLGAGEIGRSIQALNEAGGDLATYFLLQASLNVSFGIFIAVALWLIGIPSPGLWGVTAAFMRFIPYVGSLLSAAFPLALAAMIDPGWVMLPETAAVFLVGDITVGQFIEPLLFGRHTRLSPIAVLLSAAFWTFLWGAIGLILAVPLTLTIIVIGQHVPHLEFLGILLGNEPALEPREKLYRQLLAGDIAESTKNADHWLQEKGLVSYLDEIAIPALRMASDDHRSGVLSREQMNELKNTLSEYLVHVRELLDFKSEQESERANASNQSRQAAGALVIAGRGIIDEAAGELVAETIRFELGIAATCPSPGGLTAISAAADSAGKSPSDIVVLISVGEVTRAQLDLLLRRAKRVFEGSPIMIGYWNEPDISTLPVREHDTSIEFARSVKSLIEMLGRAADENVIPSSAPLKAV